VQHPYEAAQFAIWVTTATEALELDNVNGGLYPPLKDAVAKVPAMQTGVEFYGGQNVWELFDDAALHIPPGWVWGPTMTQVNQDLSDEMSKVFQGQQTVYEALGVIQTKTIDTMEAQGLAVTK
ncbi:MAG: hypothetical protein LBR19_02125, partial [Bifidobacteriaceae bacterium]|nr:hypothetical protein [Bifidobacteriaceae bacterium]